MTILASLSGQTAGIEEALVLLLIVAAAVAVVARRVGVPYTVGLVLVGLALGRHDASFNDLRLSSDLVFYVFLPILLFEAAFNLEARHLITDWRRILALAVPGVLVAFAITAARASPAGRHHVDRRAAVRGAHRRHRPGERRRRLPAPRRARSGSRP